MKASGRLYFKEKNKMLIKDPNKKTEEYLLQNNKKTRIGAGFIITVLLVLIAAVITTAYFIGQGYDY